jgi:cell wall-associated NlpC family hydrolase
VRTFRSLKRVPSSGRRLLATASLAALAIVGATFSGAPTASATRNVFDSAAARNVSATALGIDADALAPIRASTAPAPATSPSPAGTPAPTPPSTPTPAPTTPKPTTPPVDSPVLKLAAARTSVPAGTAASLTVAARHANGSVLGAGVVTLQMSVKGAWKAVTTTKLAANGVAKFSVKPAATSVYRAAVAPVRSGTTTIANAAASATVTLRATKSVATQIVDYAASFKGHRYVFGAAGPKYFDCSGLVLYVFKHVTGLTLPHHAAAQIHYGKRITKAQAKPGDLVFVSGSGGIHHVAIYAGKGMWWEAPHTGSWVRLVKIWAPNPIFVRMPGVNQ